MAKTPRTWTGARTPSGLKRVRQAERRHAVLQPRRTAAKTYATRALVAATAPTDGADPMEALRKALSALDRAAKVGAIHPNAAARRKSRLTQKVNAALGGAAVQVSATVTKTVSKAASVKAAKARIAAGKADKAKGAQTAAGKARAALSRTARAEGSSTASAPKTTATKATTAKTAGKTTTAKTTTATTAATKATTAKTAGKTTTAKTAGKTTTAKTTTAKTTATKTTTRKAAATKPAEDA